MRGKIFVAYHFTPKPGEARRDELYEPLIMENWESGSEYYRGEVPPDDRRFDGYEAMKWHLWKNPAVKQYEWIGLHQYRRSLDFGGLGYGEIDDLAMHHDIITCAPHKGCNMKRQYIDCHGSATWDALEKVLGPGYDFNADLIPDGGLGTMRTEVFNRYMAKQEEVFQELSSIIKPDPSDQRRSAFAERFFALYFYRLVREHPESRVKFLPRVQGQKQH